MEERGKIAAVGNLGLRSATRLPQATLLHRLRGANFSAPTARDVGFVWRGRWRDKGCAWVVGCSCDFCRQAIIICLGWKSGFAKVAHMTPNPAAPAVSAGADQWFTPWRFAGLLGLLILASFPEVVIGSGTFFHRDFALFGYPLAFYHRECFWSGQAPLWTPLSYCGVPFLAQWNTMTLYPLSLLYLLLPLSWSLGMFCLAHLFLAGLGMYFLARDWIGNRFAASISGVGLVFSALMLNCLMWPNNMAALGWMPWVIWTVERAWKDGGRRLLPAIFTGTLQMLSGAPEVILLTWTCLALLLLSNAGSQLRLFGKECARFILTAAIVGGLAAIQLMPFLDLIAHSQRNPGFSDSTWSMPIWGWANFLVPLFRARPTELGIYCQPGQYWVFSYYLGIGTTTLALLAAWQVRQRKACLLAGLTLVCLLLALGERGIVYATLRKAVPALGFMRYPIKFVIVPAFTVPLLAGFYVGCLRASSPVQWPRLRRRMLWLGGLVIAAILGIILLAFRFNEEGVSPLLITINGLTRVVFLAALLAVLLLSTRAFPPRLQLLLRLGVLACLWLDTMSMGIRPNPVVARDAYEPGLIRRELRMNAVPTVPESRAMLRGDTERTVSYIQFSDPLKTVLYSRLALFSDANLLDAVPKVIGCYSLYLGELGDVLEIVYSSSMPPPGLADFLGVSQINTPGKATEWIPRPSHLPWITGGQRPNFAGEKEVLRELAQPNFEPHKTVFLPADARSHITVTNTSEPRILVREFSPHLLRFESESTEPALIVIAQSFYHNWKPLVDDGPAPLLRANHAFQVVEVPAGRHEVRLVYEDCMFRWGAFASAFSLAGCLAFWSRHSKRASLPTQ